MCVVNQCKTEIIGFNIYTRDQTWNSILIQSISKSLFVQKKFKLCLRYIIWLGSNLIFRNSYNSFYFLKIQNALRSWCALVAGTVKFYKSSLKLISCCKITTCLHIFFQQQLQQLLQQLPQRLRQQLDRYQRQNQQFLKLRDYKLPISLA